MKNAGWCIVAIVAAVAIIGLVLVLAGGDNLTGQAFKRVERYQALPPQNAIAIPSYVQSGYTVSDGANNDIAVPSTIQQQNYRQAAQPSQLMEYPHW